MLIEGKHKICFSNMVRESANEGYEITMTLRFPHIESMITEASGIEIIKEHRREEYNRG